jgi:hypothetical protein
MTQYITWLIFLIILSVKSMEDKYGGKERKNDVN